MIKTADWVKNIRHKMKKSYDLLFNHHSFTFYYMNATCELFNYVSNNFISLVAIKLMLVFGFIR